MCTSCPCHYCEEVFSSESNLKRHVQSIHRRNLSFECQKDEKSYLIQQRLVILEQINFLPVKSSSSPYWPARREN